MPRATAKLASDGATGPGAETRAKTKSDARAQPRAPDGSRAASAPRKRRSLPPEARRAAILDAALEEFSARGYEGARLDDVARRAGIAKGTIYLYFADKEALFQELVRSMVSPVLATLEQMRTPDIPARMLIEGLLATFVREVYGTRRKDMIRLILTEGPRFPTIAEFYYREVVARVLAIARGELPDDALVRFPQLIVAPGLAAIMWSALFEKFEPLDVPAMIRAHIGILFGGRAA